MRRKWGTNGGISLSSSAGCQIERNLLVGNKEGFQIRDQVRVANRIGRGGESFCYPQGQVPGVLLGTMP
ncbi:MAG: hypothetical protein O3C40_22230 [Planctomycetota bacterium]|nr:hypothetical protein [Planctomycetota bacterium]